jgi:hypothetical protein
MLFKGVAKQYKDTVKFTLEIDEKPGETNESAVYKDARIKAKEYARDIFGYKGVGEDPSVSIEEAKEQVVKPSQE